MLFMLSTHKVIYHRFSTCISPSKLNWHAWCMSVNFDRTIQKGIQHTSLEYEIQLLSRFPESKILKPLIWMHFYLLQDQLQYLHTVWKERTGFLGSLPKYLNIYTYISVQTCIIEYISSNFHISDGLRMLHTWHPRD